MDVPFLSDLNKSRAALQETTATEAASAEADPDSGGGISIRKAWKEYLIQALPHARTQIKNFMLACLAEGRCHASEEEAGHRRGTSLYCELSLQDIRRAMDFQAKAASKLASEDVTSDGVAAAAESSFAQTNKRILATAQVAMKLAQETAVLAVLPRALLVIPCANTAAPLRDHQMPQKSTETLDSVVAQYKVVNTIGTQLMSRGMLRHTIQRSR